VGKDMIVLVSVAFISQDPFCAAGTLRRTYCHLSQGGTTILELDISLPEANRCTRDVARIALPPDAPAFPATVAIPTASPTMTPCTCFDEDALFNDDDLEYAYSGYNDKGTLTKVSSPTSTYELCDKAELSCSKILDQAAREKIPTVPSPEAAYFSDAGFADKCPCFGAGPIPSIYGPSYGWSVRVTDAKVYASYKLYEDYFALAYTAATETEPALMRCERIDTARIPERPRIVDGLTEEEFNRCFANMVKLTFG